MTQSYYPNTDELGTDSVPSRTRSLTLLTQSGVDLVCIKTNKAVGKRLRRFVVDKVFPALRRREPLATRRDPDDRTDAADPRVLREHRLLLREQRLRARQRAGALQRLLREFPNLGDNCRRALALKASEGEYGEDLSRFLPVEDEVWWTPTDIAKQLGVSANRVGRAITALELRGNVDGLARAVTNTAPGHNKTVTSYQYSARAVEMIRAELERTGHLQLVGEEPPEAG